MGKNAGKKSKRAEHRAEADAPRAVRLPHSTPEHLSNIEHAVAIAMAMPAHSVKSPRVPVAELLRDARSVASAATVHHDALVERGLPAQLAEELVARADALSQAQALWLADRRRGLKADATAVLLRDAEILRADAMAILGLALRKSRDGQARLADVGGGEGIAELLADLSTLSTLAKDAEGALTDINEVGSDWERALDKARKGVAAAASGGEARVVSSNKDLRDRLAVLVSDAIDEVRAFAAVAFRHDGDGARRGAFAVVGAAVYARS
jgi:hypothetical protein